MILHYRQSFFLRTAFPRELNLNPIQNQSIAAIWPLLSRIVAISQVCPGYKYKDATILFRASVSVRNMRQMRPDGISIAHSFGNRVGLNRIQSCQAKEVSMRSTQQFSITLPNEMAELVRAKVATGEYATESEVVRDGLRTLLARDRAVEDWLREKVAPAYDALKADPSRAVSVDQVRAALSAQHRKATAKTR
jgi:putative addiction module CopG family antidote